MTKAYRIEGVILKRINFGETDRILTVFSKQKGKICLVAKGIRKISSRRAPSLELFNRVSLFVVKGKNIDLISEVELLSDFPNLRKKLSLIKIVYYLLELIDCLTAENQENLVVYHLLLEVLEKINRKGKFSEQEIVAFQESLVTTLGFGCPANHDLASFEWHIEKILNRELNSKKFLKT